MPDLPTSSPALETEFDVLMARAGITVPENRRAALLAGFAELRDQVALLRQPRSAAAEPSNVFQSRRPEAA